MNPKSSTALASGNSNLASEVHVVSEVILRIVKFAPNWRKRKIVLGELNFTANIVSQLHCAVAQLHFCLSKNFTEIENKNGRRALSHNLPLGEGGRQWWMRF